MGVKRNGGIDEAEIFIARCKLDLEKKTRSWLKTRLRAMELRERPQKGRK